MYAGRVRLWHLALVLLAGLVALAAAVFVTPVGQEWCQYQPRTIMFKQTSPQPTKELGLITSYPDAKSVVWEGAVRD